MSGPSSRASKGASDLALSRSRMLISELSRPEPLVPGVPPAFQIGWHYSRTPQDPNRMHAGNARCSLLSCVEGRRGLCIKLSRAAV